MEHKRTILLTNLFIALLILSCNNARQEKSQKIIIEWVGKKIEFPKDIICSSFGKDTIGIDLYNDNYKVLLYVDSTGCSSCKLKLHEWKSLIDKSDSIFFKSPDFLMFFQPKREDEHNLQFLFKQYGFNYPVFIDRGNKINDLNKFSSNYEYQCFLLDRNNKVVLVGNPVYNPAILKLYEKIINKKETAL